jgi:pyruvate dehydrogenase E2 component (dihydrolipoamide acetyltransferase)
MPSLGAEMDEGRLLEWYVQPGQQVRRGSVIALIETDKANIDVEVFEDGIVEELLVEVGTKVPVGTPLARLGDGKGATAAADVPAATEPARPPARPTVVAAEPAVEPEAPATRPADPDGVPMLNPVLRRLARDLDVDVTTVSGTGPGGRVTRADVERAAPLVPTVPGDPYPPPSSPRPGRSSPYARRLAAERELDAASMTGSGPGGAVVARDLGGDDAESAPDTAPGTAPAEPVVTAAEPAAGPAATAVPARATTDERYLAMRRSIARAMARSKREIPHYYLGEHVDMEPALSWLADHNAERPAAHRLLPAVLVLKAVASACTDFEDLNGFWEDDALRPGDGVHVGVAISLRRGGLLAPAIRDADAKSLDELMEALRDLVTRTRNGGLRGSELSDGTITVTNLGDTGVETVYGVIQPPQVALVGAGAITERPWAVEGMVGSRRCIHLTLAADHRASDGHRGALFLAAIAARLREPEKL